MTTDSFTDQIAAEDLEARRAAVESIRPLKYLRDEIARLEADKKPHDEKLRTWLIEHEGAHLPDGEAELEAFMQDGGTSIGYDTPAEIKKVNPRLYEQLELLGCFEVNHRMVAELQKQHQLEASEIERFRHKIGRSPTLQIKSIKE